MAATVPLRRTEPAVSPVSAGSPVSARTWRETAQLLAWVRGRGQVLVPVHAPNVQIADSLDHLLHYRFTAGRSAIARVWAIRMWQDLQTGATVPAQVQITLPGGLVATVWPSTNPAYDSGVGVFVEPLVSKAGAAENVTLTLKRISGAASVRVSTVGCWELPRAVLAESPVDMGADLDGLRPGLAVYDDDYQSIGGIVRGWAQTTPHRVMWAQTFPELGVTSTSPTDLFSLPVPVLPPKPTRTATTYTATWDVRARVSDGATAGTVQITTGRSGNTALISVPLGATSHAWRGSSTIVLDCEAPDSADGLPGASSFETVQIAVKATGGGTVFVESVLLET